MDLFDLFAKITLDSDEYTKGVEDAGKKSESLKSKVDGLASKIKSAQTSFDGFSDKAKESNSTMDSAAEKTSAASEETQKLATELKKAESNYKATSEELKNTKDELNNYGEKADEATDKTSKLGNALKNGLATAAKIGAAAIGAAATGIGALVKSSVDAYANYEQLVGGVETLFDSASDKVQEYAARAYETAGMSANEYMETVTSFSASLLQSLDGDTAAAAEKANLAVTDMSDNANKMG